jgi:deazaflavin-dependent oxidoreductase (nitroreductase family)
VPAVRINPLTVSFWRLHRMLFRISGGRIGARVAGFDILLLTTLGRRSGRPVHVALSYVEDDGHPVVLGSRAGEDRHPGWYLNLQKNPIAEVLIRGETTRVRARTTVGEEYVRLWRRFIAVDPDYAEYQRRTSRRLPIIALEPADDAA